MASTFFQKNVILAPYSTYKIGGAAKLFGVIKTQKEAALAIEYCAQNQIDYYILGKGSNTLFDDRGFDGAILYNDLRGYQKIEDLYQIYSGTSFAYFGSLAAKQGYGGLEYAVGIPGSVGGAIFMNAGASNQEIAPLVESVDFLNEEGEVETYLKSELSFKYRWSLFHQLKGMIISAKLKLYLDPSARKRQLEIIKKRKSSQPYDEPSCGCIFRNGDDYIAGALIDDLGLKEMEVGGAKVSGLHANFIVNTGSAKAQDVKDLILKIEEEVYKRKKIKLQREVRFLPYSRRSYAL